MTQTTTINVDISKPNIPTAIYAKQHDIDTRKVEVSLYDSGNEYTVPASVSGQVNIAKPDGTGCYYDVDSISGNKVTFTLVEQALAAHGEAVVDVSLISTENDEITERLTSFSFRLIIEKRAIEDSSIESSDYYNALMVLADTVQRSVTFTPSVSNAGVISWTNNGGLTNPESINIKGPTGETGSTGAQGYSITSVYAKSTSTEDGGTSTYGIKNSNNTEIGTFSVKNGSKGSTGSAINHEFSSLFTNGTTTLPSNAIAIYTVVGNSGTITLNKPSSGFCFYVIKNNSGVTIKDGNTTLIGSSDTSVHFGLADTQYHNIL